MANQATILNKGSFLGINTGSYKIVPLSVNPKVAYKICAVLNMYVEI